MEEKLETVSEQETPAEAEAVTEAETPAEAEAPAEEETKAEPPAETETEAEVPAEEAPEEETSGSEDEKPVRKKKRLRSIMAVVTLLFVGLAAASLWLVLTLKDKEHECSMTKLPTGLSAVDTVKKYFEYWDAGNNEGMNQAALPDVNRDPTSSDECFNLGLCWFCDITLTRAEQSELLAEGFEGCAESAIVSVDFTYKRSFGFGDENIPENNQNWEFYLAKINEGDDFRIISVQRG